MRRLVSLVALTLLAVAAIGSTQALAATADASAGPVLTPLKLPFYPNDAFGSYEPTVTADGNTIYFARFSTVGDASVLGNSTDLFVTHRIPRSGGWPGSGDEWTKPERLPDTVNSPYTDQEPQISANGKTLHWMSMRPGGYGDADIYVSYKKADGSWTPARNMGPTINSPYMDHCFVPYDVEGVGTKWIFMSIRPRTAGAEPTADFYTTKQNGDGWTTPRRLESEVLDSIDNKCRLTTVTKNGMVFGVLTRHKFGEDHEADIAGTYHKQVFIQFDRQAKKWVGPAIEAPYNVDGVDGACTLFSPDGTRMIWSAGYDHGPGPISQASGQGGSVYDLFWLKTTDLLAWYRAQAALQ